jgi:hypothetical protein
MIAPSGPVAFTAANVTPALSARRRARGEMKSREEDETKVEVEPVSPLSLALTLASITAIALNTVTWSPGCAVTRRKMPVAGASTSRDALSVSMTNSGSPC